MLVRPRQDQDTHWTTKITDCVTLPYKLNVQQGICVDIEDSTWEKAFFKAQQKVLYVPRRKGAPPLRESAALKALELGLPDLEELPWTVSAYLFEFAIQTGDYLTFQTWKVLSKLLRSSKGRHLPVSLPIDESLSLALYRYECAIREPALSIEDYIKPLRSPKFDFLTSLSITVDFAVSNLVKLYQIENLGALEIINPDHFAIEDVKTRINVGDRLIRTWAEKAAKGTHFKVLRILRLWHFKDVTSVSLGFLNSFPCLAVYDVRGCSFSESISTLSQHLEASVKGWNFTLGRDILPILTGACQEMTEKYAKLKGFHYRDDRRQSLSNNVKGQRSEAKEPSCGERPPRIRLDGRFVWDIGIVERVERGDPVQLRFLEPKNERLRFTVQEDSHPQLGGKDLRRMPHNIYQGLSKVNANQEWFDWAEIKWRLFWRSFQEAETGPFDFERTSFATFARIGELRADKDLKWAGVKDLETAMLVGDDLVSPVPMVCIQLGPEATPEWLYPEQPDCGQSLKENLKKGGALTFYKLGWIPPKVPGKEKAGGGQPQGLGGASRSRPVRPVKKQALGDMLSGFTY